MPHSSSIDASLAPKHSHHAAFQGLGNRHWAAIKNCFLNMWMSPWTSFLTLMVLGLSLSLPVSGYLFLKNVQEASGLWDKGTGMTLFLNPQTSSTALTQLVEDLNRTQEVERVEFQSASDSLNEFKHFSHIEDALALLDTNPFPPVITLFPNQAYQSTPSLNDLYHSLLKHPDIESIYFNQDWVVKLNAFLSLGQALWMSLSLLIGLAVILVVSNTIRLALSRHQQEIEVLSFLGATKQFISRPFIYRGLIYGTLGGLLALAFLQGLLWQLSSPVQALAQAYHSHFTLVTLSIHQSLTFLLGAIILGWLGALIALAQQWHALNLREDL